MWELALVFIAGVFIGLFAGYIILEFKHWAGE